MAGRSRPRSSALAAASRPAPERLMTPMVRCNVPGGRTAVESHSRAGGADRSALRRARDAVRLGLAAAVVSGRERKCVRRGDRRFGGDMPGGTRLD